jgi:hypothetical protein
MTPLVRVPSAAWNGMMFPSAARLVRASPSPTTTDPSAGGFSSGTCRV